METNTGPQGEAVGPANARERVWQVLSGFDEPVTLSALSAATGLHVNTLRGHLDALRERHEVTRVALRHEGPGRPAWGYVAREAPYAALAEALASALEQTRSDQSLSTRAAAVEAGRAWGQRLRQQLTGDAETGDEQDRRALMLALEHVGFAPTPGPEDEDPDGRVRLTRCPFLDTARAHPEAVCGIHLGLVEGALGGHARRTSATLRPFAEPGACLVDLT